ncbi:MAG: DUF493 family protein [Spirochaetia bacterium]
MEFPVDFNLRIICNGSDNTAEYFASIAKTLEQVGIAYGEMTGEAKKGGKYYTMIIPVTVADRGTYDTLYNSLREISFVAAAF